MRLDVLCFSVRSASRASVCTQTLAMVHVKECRATNVASQPAVCTKVYRAKPAQMLASYRVLATTALRHSVMQVRTDFDAVWGHVVGPRWWEYGVTLDRIGGHRLCEVVAPVPPSVCTATASASARAFCSVLF